MPRKSGKAGKPGKTAKSGKVNKPDKSDPSENVRARVADMLAKATATSATSIKKEAVLYMLAEGFSLTAAASSVGSHRTTLWRWKEEDQEFAKAIDEANAMGADWYEDQLRTQAAQGNIAAIVVGLKMRRRFSERVDLNANVATNKADTEKADQAVFALMDQIAGLKGAVGLLQGRLADNGLPHELEAKQAANDPGEPETTEAGEADVGEAA